MITLKEYFNKIKKEEAYDFYQRICPKPEEYAKITRAQIYHNIIKLYIDDPEIILRLCNVEEINILKMLLEENISKKNNGYIEYLLINTLESNYLIFSNNNEYYLPEDLINPVKMAINLYNEEEYSLKDVTDSVILGLVRIHNVLTIPEMFQYLQQYNIIFEENSFKTYLKNSLRNNNKIALIHYKKESYLISLEHQYYKEIIPLKANNIPNHGTLEEVISVGKYKINLFKEPIFNFLCYLEHHLEPKYIDIIIDDLILYAGFDLNNPEALEAISGQIPELQEMLKKVLIYFPCWLYNGETKATMLNAK